ncbi:MAG: hydroxymethylbilane synthase, partial [Gimesia sp.]
TMAERSLLAFLRAGCHAPIGILSHIEETELRLEAVVLSGDGQELIAASASGSFEEAKEIGNRAGKKLLDAGAGRLISHDES